MRFWFTLLHFNIRVKYSMCFNWGFPGMQVKSFFKHGLTSIGLICVSGYQGVDCVQTSYWQISRLFAQSAVTRTAVKILEYLKMEQSCWVLITKQPPQTNRQARHPTMLLHCCAHAQRTGGAGRLGNPGT